MRIRNPWGSETYTGPYYDKDSVWTEELKKEANYIDSDDGLWWIKAEDFHESFEETTMNPDVTDEHLSYFAQMEI